MFTDIKEAITYIESKRHKRSVDDLRQTLNSVHLPMKQPNMVHIGGTNGKGSTINYLRAILNAHGYRVGTFTSPYLVCHNDRICIDGEMIPDEKLLALINKYHDVIEQDDMSMFEIDVMLMLDYFSEEDLDFRLIECGIGGTHDKTNVIDPVISAITNIGEDHLEQIGPTIFDVINEKIGIIKPGQIFVTTESRGTILARFQEQCDVMSTLMVVVPDSTMITTPFELHYRDMAFDLRKQGLYQIRNAHLALTIASKLITLNSEKTVKAVEEASWGGRYERFHVWGKEVILDGAHNVPGIMALMETIRESGLTDYAIIFSSLKDKQTRRMLEALKELNAPIILTSFADERVIDPEAYQSMDVTIIKNAIEALKLACDSYSTVIVTGSLHFISAMRQQISNHKNEKGL